MAYKYRAVIKEMENAVGLLEAAGVFTKHFPPPPTYVVEENMPDMLCFLGSILFFLCFFVQFTELFEHEDVGLFLSFRSFEYASFPIYLTLGLACGLTSYIVAYTQTAHFGLTDDGHAALSSCMFFFFAKHLFRSTDMSPRRASMLVATGSLPLLCLSVLEAGTVRIRSCRFFYALILAIAVMPLGTLLKDWRGQAYDPGASKVRKRIFTLFFAVVCFVGGNTPTRLCTRHRASSDLRQAGVLLFDFALLYCAHDGLWH
jgi:hypothetical protein